MELIFPVQPSSAALCISSQKGADNTPVFWLLLSSTHPASRLLLQLPCPSPWRWARSWEGSQPEQLTSLTRGSFRTVWCLLSSECGGKGGGRGDIPYLHLSFEQPVPKPCFPEGGWTSPADGKERITFSAGKNLAELEKKTEKNLLMLCEEKERQHKKLCELKREILLREREQKLDEALDKQMEVLSPLVPVCERFKDQYKSFAASLDATRHELPIKNIHIEGDTLTYLGELQKQLTITQELLTEIMPGHLEESEKTFNVLKDLKEVSQKLDKELQRSFAEVQNLSFQVSKEVSLHNQKICEENHGLDLYQNMKPAACMLTNVRNEVFFCMLSHKESSFFNMNLIPFLSPSALTILKGN
uniref:HAUS augmin like complex subunit 8 n=1 Tax=Strix occidentalis caurina TaxID=311401 RepID=A0A8D0EKH3_STROC